MKGELVALRNDVGSVSVVDQLVLLLLHWAQARAIAWPWRARTDTALALGIALVKAVQRIVVLVDLNVCHWLLFIFLNDLGGRWRSKYVIHRTLIVFDKAQADEVVSTYLALLLESFDLLQELSLLPIGLPAYLKPRLHHFSLLLLQLLAPHHVELDLLLHLTLLIVVSLLYPEDVFPSLFSPEYIDLPLERGLPLLGLVGLHQQLLLLCSGEEDLVDPLLLVHSLLLLHFLQILLSLFLLPLLADY